MIEIGKQYMTEDNRFDKSGFKSKARLHQSKFRAERLKVPYENYGNYLTQSDAEKGLNFYNDFAIFEAVEAYRTYNKPLYSNMLRSEHIPFNFFIPLRFDLNYCKNILNEILGNCVKSVESKALIDNKENIKIEFAPTPKGNYLDDKTSFDAYIEYTHIDNSRGILGIEVKYTEREYEISGKTEEDAINNPNSKYYLVSSKSGLFKEGTAAKLKSNHFRQAWRNHILGESIIQFHPATFNHFTSITFFPSGNVHFNEVSKEYPDLLKSNNNNFLTLQYEDYFSILRKLCPNQSFSNWIDYLTDRYIVK
jgi:hypothetical protein